MKEDSIKEDMKILEGIIKGDEDCINAIYSQMKVKNDNDEDIQYYKKEIQSIKNIVDNYLKEKARADKLEKEYSAMLTESDENECDYKRVLKENEELKNDYENLSNSVVVKNHCIKNSIPVSLVEEMIEELEQERTLKYDNYMGYKIESREQQDIDKKVQILQELLEKRK